MWLATKFSFVDLELKQVAVIVITVSLLGLLPYVGFILCTILFIVLVMRLSGCSAFDAAAVGIFTNIFVFSVVAITALSLVS